MFNTQILLACVAALALSSSALRLAPSHKAVRPAATAGGVPSVEIVPGVFMPQVGLGTWLYNDSVAYTAVRVALDVGYTMIDTAIEYRNQRGVGQAIKDSGVPRNKIFITSKISGGLTADETDAAVAQCFQELGVQQIDLMLIHYPASWEGVGGKKLRQEEWLALEKYVNMGTIRAIGVSHYCEQHIRDILEVNTVPIAVNQAEYHVGMGRAGDNATDGRFFDEELGITFQSFSPLCGPCGTDELVNGPLVTSIGAKYGKTGAQVSLKWQTQQGMIVIPKSSSRQHLMEDIDLFSWELSQADMLLLSDAVSPPVTGGGDNVTSGDCLVD